MGVANYKYLIKRSDQHHLGPAKLKAMAVSSWSLIVALCCSLLASIVCGQHVAPGDEDPFCFDSPFRVPVPPKQKILLDTQNYKEKTLIDTNGATVRWVSGNFDGLVTDGANYNVS